MTAFNDSNCARDDFAREYGNLEGSSERTYDLLGHKTITMTMRYAHHYPESLRSSIEVLDNCYNSATFCGQRC